MNAYKSRVECQKDMIIICNITPVYKYNTIMSHWEIGVEGIMKIWMNFLEILDGNVTKVDIYQCEL